jgi:spore coat protein CotF
MLEELLSGISPAVAWPPNAGEAYHLHQSLSAYYYLRAKMVVYVAQCQDKALKAFLEKISEILKERIERHVALMNKMGVPLPQSVPESTELTDQLIALDTAAMAKGMLSAASLGLQSTAQPEIADLYRDIIDSTIKNGGVLLGIMQKSGWISPPPAYAPQSPH